MTRMVVRYRMKPERTEENERLIRHVFQELKEKAPDGVRYMAVRLADGTFLHFVEDTGNVITGLSAFHSFRSGVKERCAEPPQQNDATVVGNYRMLSE